MILIYTFPLLDANDFDELGDKEARQLGGWEAIKLECQEELGS
jgi:hypothetical protein